MKSAFGFLPWNPKPGPKSKCELTCGSTAVDEMKEKKCVRNHRDSFNRMKAKISPLLRLNSEGEITGNNNCDSRHSSFTEKSSKQSNSFDSGLIKNLSPNKFSDQYTERNIPSFKKSFSVPSVIMPANQSFPPPSSSSYLRRNSFACSVAESLPPYSSSPRVLGFDEIFKTKPFSCVISPDVQCNIGVTSSKEPESGNSVIDHHKSKSMCNNKNSMAAGENNRKADHSACGGGKKSKTSGEYSTENSIDSALMAKKETSPGVPVPKPKRKRSRHRRRRKQNPVCESFTPTSSSSPVKNNSSLNSSVEVTPKRGNFTNSFDDDKCCRNSLKASPKCHVEAPTPESGASSFSFDSSVSCTVGPDSDHSAVEECFSDDDLIFGECSVVEEDSPKVSAKKMTQKRKKSGGSSRLVEIQSSETSDNESDSEQKCSALFFSLSVTVSEDEENDSSVDWDLSTSPCQSASDGFTFEFEFNTGLSLDAILGGAPTPLENAMSQELKNTNAQWNKFYTSSGGNSGSSSCQTQRQQKVRFACDEKLATVHFVGDEERAGHWHLFALERARFKRRIEEVERAVAPILSARHRAKVWGKTDLSDTDKIL